MQKLGELVGSDLKFILVGLLRQQKKRLHIFSIWENFWQNFIYFNMLRAWEVMYVYI